MEFKALIQGGIFTFFVGREGQRFDVHAKAISAISDALSALINNGSLQESIERQCHLEQVEPETFTMFCEYAYHKAYQVPVQIFCPKKSAPTYYRCRVCSGTVDYRDYEVYPPSTYPYCCDSCASSAVDRQFENQRTNRRRRAPWYCCKVDCSETHSKMESMLCPSHHNPQDIEAYTDVPLYRLETSLRDTSFGRFYEERFGYDKQQNSLKRLSSLVADIDGTEAVVWHAKLYVFAKEHLVEPLKRLCLLKLYGDLFRFSIHDHNAEEIVKLLMFAYENSSDEEDNEWDTGSELRELIIRYAAAQAEFLVNFRLFKEMLQQGGEVVSDFATVMVKRMVSEREASV